MNGRPPGPNKLQLTQELRVEIARRVRLRLDAEREAALHSNSAIAKDYGVSEVAIAGAVRRLRIWKLL